MLISAADSQRGPVMALSCGPAALRMQAWAAPALRYSNNIRPATPATIRLANRDSFMQWMLAAR